MISEEFYIDKVHCKRWAAENPTAVLQIVHGLGEMTEYYEQLGAYLAKKGISVYMAELRYHGKTTLPVNEGDIVGFTIKDQLVFSDFIRKTESAPLFLSGHSLGATIAAHMMIYATYKGVILTGCAYFENVEELLSDLELEIKKNGMDAPCEEVFLKIFGNVVSLFPEKCTVSWVTSDIERATYYESLPYTNVMYPNRFYLGFLNAAKEVQTGEIYKGLRLYFPILLACGKCDAVGGFGKYPPEFKKQLQSLGADVTLNLYDDMRHSVLQERERERVYKDIEEFIGKALDKNKN